MKFYAHGQIHRQRVLLGPTNLSIACLQVQGKFSVNTPTLIFAKAPGSLAAILVLFLRLAKSKKVRV
jgi:hypothetical protein